MVYVVVVRDLEGALVNVLLFSSLEKANEKAKEYKDLNVVITPREIQ